MKRNIRAFWLEARVQGMIKVTILRDRRNWEEQPVYSYVPTPSSLNRINRVARSVTRSAFSPYRCEPIHDKNVVFGWVLFHEENAVYPPPKSAISPKDNHVVFYKTPQFGDTKRRPETTLCPQQSEAA